MKTETINVNPVFMLTVSTAFALFLLAKIIVILFVHLFAIADNLINNTYDFIQSKKKIV